MDKPLTFVHTKRYCDEDMIVQLDELNKYYGFKRRNKVKESKPIYGFTDYEEFNGIVWETEKGMIVTVNGSINTNSNLTIKSCETGEIIKDVDMRNVLMDVLGL